MKHLILGGTGTVGSAVIQTLLARHESIRLLTRSREKAASLPSQVEAVVGDLANPATAAAALRGVDTIFLLNGLSPSELQEGLFALEEARRANVQRLVYISVHGVEKGPRIPHFASKIAMEVAIRDSGLNYTVLRPNNFYQNDLLLLEVIQSYGIYPQPFGDIGLSRTDVRDIADAAANALTSDDLTNQVIPIVGPDPLTASDTARIYSEALGKPIQYAGNDLAAWAASVSSMMPPWMIYDLQLMYAMFQEKGLIATPQQLDASEQAIGHPPRTFKAFVEEALTA